MNRKRIAVGALLTLGLVVAGTSVSWSQQVPAYGTMRVEAPQVTGIAGPIGPQQVSPVAAYFKRVTYSGGEFGQFHEIGVKLPAGRYLVEVRSPGAVDAADCLGVSFPLVPPQAPNRPYTGYATVAKSGDEASVSCFEEPPDPSATVSYEVFFIPA